MALMILDRCRIEPAASKQQKLVKFPLTFFDIEWLKSIPMENILLYQFPCSKAYFLETIVPSLKKSLSQTLQHYLPFAGNIIFPPNLGVPYIQFQPGDSVDFSVFEYSNPDSTAMMSYLTGNQPREVDKFYTLVPALPGTQTGSKKVGIFALQVTFFPNAGITIGWTQHHAAGDVSSIVRFLKAWGLIARLGEEGYLAASEPLPFLDRSTIKDPVITGLKLGYSLSDHYWNQIKNDFKYGNFNIPAPRQSSEHVRATFVLNANQIENLKNLVRSLKPILTHISSFVVSSAYIWNCMSRLSEEKEVEEEIIVFPMDARARMDPPAPATYFGNCLAPGKVAFTLPKQYSDHERIALCAELIEKFVKTITEKGPRIFTDADRWLDGRWATPNPKKSVLAIAASPKFNFYDVDFGWGAPTKCEVLATDVKGTISLCTSREGGLEIGLSSTKDEMDAFAVLFSKGLEGNNLSRTISMSRL